MSGRAPALAAVVTVALAVPAAAGAGPTLTADHPCYLEGEDMVLTGDGYTPGVGIAVFLSAPDRVLGSVDATADLAGRLATTVRAPTLPAAISGRRISLTMSANDQSKFDPVTGAPLAAPQDSSGILTVTLTRANVSVPQWRPGHRFRPRAMTTFDAYGLALDSGRILYAHYTRSRRLIKTVPLGTLTGDCGDLKVRMRGFPFRPIPVGRYTVRFDTTRAYAARNAYVTYSLDVFRAAT